MNDILHLIGITPQLLATQVIGFIILIVVLNQLLFKRIFAILDERRDSIQATYDQMDRDREAMEDTRKQYEQRLANIEAEARETIQAAVKEAQQLRDNLIADAQKQAESIVEKGRNESERERQKAFMEMREQIVSIAVTAAGKVVGEALNDQRHARLVDEFITSVGLQGGTSGARISSNGTSANGATGGASAQ